MEVHMCFSVERSWFRILVGGSMCWGGLRDRIVAYTLTQYKEAWSKHKILSSIFRATCILHMFSHRRNCKKCWVGPDPGPESHPDAIIWWQLLTSTYYESASKSDNSKLTFESSQRVAAVHFVTLHFALLLLLLFSAPHCRHTTESGILGCARCCCVIILNQ